MKRLAAALIALFSVALLPSAVRAAESPQASQVVLNWEEFIKLWTQAQRPDPTPDAPPVDAAISRAVYSGTVLPRTTEFTAEFEISVLATDKWVRVPFLPASAGLKEARLDGTPVPVITENGMHAIVVKGAGRRTLRVAFSIATGARNGDLQFNFNTAETPITLVSLAFAQPGLDVAVEPAQAVTLRDENGGTTVKAILPPTRVVRVSWRKKQPADVELPAKVYATFRQLITIDDGVARVNLNAGYNLLHAGVNALKIRVPAGISVLNVTGDSIQGWNVDKGVLTIGFDRRVKGERLIVVQAERPLAERNGTFEAPIFAAVDVVRQETHVGVEATGNIEVSAGDAAFIRQVDVKELPADIWSRARNPLLYGFTGTERGAAFNLTFTRHEDVPVLTSTVDSGNAVTVLTKDGQAITRVVFQVRNHLKQFLTLSLPENAEVWSAFVNGRPVKPSRNKQGQVLIPLEKSGSGDASEAFPVQIVYYVRAVDLGGAGVMHSALPEIDLPMTQLLWSVYAPEELRIVHAGGNMEMNRGLVAIGSESIRELRRQAMEDESGFLAKAEKKINLAARGAMDAAAPSLQARMEYDMAAVSAGSSVTGFTQNHVLPIAFRMPEAGQLVRFGKIMVNRETPHVSLTYVSHDIVGYVKLIAWSLAALLLFRRRRDIRPFLTRAVAVVRKSAGLLRPERSTQGAH